MPWDANRLSACGRKPMQRLAKAEFVLEAWRAAWLHIAKSWHLLAFQLGINYTYYWTTTTRDCVGPVGLTKCAVDAHAPLNACYSRTNPRLAQPQPSPHTPPPTSRCRAVLRPSRRESEEMEGLAASTPLRFDAAIRERGLSDVMAYMLQDARRSTWWCPKTHLGKSS